MNKKIWVMVGLGIVCIAGLIGCNIFSWTHSAGSGEDATVLLADADSALASGDYAKAMEYYQKAIDADPANSKARYGYVNAYTKNSGLNIIDLAKNTGGQRSIANLVPGVFSKAPAKAYNLLDNTSNPYGITLKKLEDLAIALVDKFEPIVQGKCDGKISATDADVNLNLAIGYLLRGIFLILDPPNGNDGTIDYNYNIKYDENTKTADLVDSNGNIIPKGTVLSKISEALNYLTRAVASLNTATANSIAKDAISWTKVYDALNSVRTMLIYYAG